MQIASRQCLWNDSAGGGTVIIVEMTPETGLYLKFVFNAADGKDVRIRWGDGSGDDIGFSTSDMTCGHTYAKHGRYTIIFQGARSIGFRNLDGQSQYSYDAAILSFVDLSGDIIGSRSPPSSARPTSKGSSLRTAAGWGSATSPTAPA